MNKRSLDRYDYDDPLGPSSIYDKAQPSEDLWFLPDPDAVLLDREMPLPRADRQALDDPTEWFAAQGKHAAQLARAAMVVGQLDMLVAEMGQGAIQRLALREAEALTWAAGTPIALDEIGCDQLQARARTDLAGLQTARWAVRRLMGEGPLDDLRGFLGLHRTAQNEAQQDTAFRLTGQAFDDAADGFHEARAQADGAHCIVRAAYERHLWRLTELSPEGAQIEGAVWAARRLASDCSVLSFVPMGQAARRLRGTGPDELGRYLSAVAQGAVGAKAELSRIRSWAQKAKAETAQIKGDTPARIIDALVAKPLCSTEMVEQKLGVSRDTAERVLRRLHEMGVVREITGAARFRLWAARL